MVCRFIFLLARSTRFLYRDHFGLRQNASASSKITLRVIRNNEVFSLYKPKR